jgi:hypothetical protein
MLENINGYKILVGKSEIKRPLRTRGRRYETNIKMDLKEIGPEGHPTSYLTGTGGCFPNGKLAGT